jgi:hypothetical protein
MNFAVPLGLAFLVLAVPEIYVGWCQARGDGVPERFRTVPGLGALWSQRYLPQPWRVRPTVAGTVQVFTGVGLAIMAVALIVLGFADAFR